MSYPDPDELKREYDARQQELRALRKLLHLSRAQRDAEQARKRREETSTGASLSLNDPHENTRGGRP